MSPLHPPARMCRCSALSRSFLRGPDGPCGAPSGQDLRSGSLMGKGEPGPKQDQLGSECPRFEGNPLRSQAKARG
jgi:hypothetical protein